MGALLSWQACKSQCAGSNSAVKHDARLIYILLFVLIYVRVSITCGHMTTEISQHDRAITLLSRGMARLSELLKAGITAATVSRMEQRGEVVRLSRGLYQLSGAPWDENHMLAEAAKLVPKGVICLQSALAYHDLIDRIPPVI